MKIGTRDIPLVALLAYVLTLPLQIAMWVWPLQSLWSFRQTRTLGLRIFLFLLGGFGLCLVVSLCAYLLSSSLSLRVFFSHLGLYFAGGLLYSVYLGQMPFPTSRHYGRRGGALPLRGPAAMHRRCRASSFFTNKRLNVR